MNYCFYHSIDNDGYMSGAIVKKAIPDAILIPYDYEKFDISRWALGDNMYFVDCVPQPYLEVKKLYDIIGKGLYIIDHHKTAIESPILQQIKEEIPDNIVLSNEHAACRLCWEFFYPKVKVPTAVKYLSQYDAWQLDGEYDWDNIVLPFQMGIRLQETDPTKSNVMTDFLDLYSQSNVASTIQDGRIVLQYQTLEHKKNMANNAFEYRWKSFTFLCINSTHSNSQLFDSMYDPEKHDFMCRFCLNKNQEVSVSIYTTRPDKDASEIAKRFGGGGHRKAAGFKLDLVPVGFYYI